MRRLIVRGPGLRGPAGADGKDGLPGVNAVPADEAVAAYVEAGETRAAVEAAVADMIVGIEPSTGLLLYLNNDGFYEIFAPVQPPPDLPGAPADVTATGGLNQATVAWTTPTFPEDGPITDYRVQYRVSGETTWTTFNREPSTATSVVVTGLQNAVDYEFRVSAINVTGASAYSSVASTNIGDVDGVVLSDTFTRTASDVVGTNPDTGLHPYAGAANQFEVNGTRMVGKSGANGGLVSIDTGARGARTLDAVLRISTLASAAATTARLYVAWIDSANNLYFQVSVSAAGTASLSMSGNFAGVFATLPTGFPAGTIPATAAEADQSIRLELNGTAWSATVNGVVRSGTLTADQANAVALATKIGFTAATTPTNVRWDSVSHDVDGTYV